MSFLPNAALLVVAVLGTIHVQNLVAIEATTITNNNVRKVSSNYKAPNSKTPLEVTKQWEKEDLQLQQYITDVIPAYLDHTGTSPLDGHLMGVQAVLRYWNSPSYLTSAGLFHSIYGTEGFQGFSVSLTERPTIQTMIGPEAEKLCWTFCMIDRFSFDQSVFAWKKGTPERNEEGEEEDIIKLVSRPELGRFEITLTKHEWIDFVELSLADWLEQVEGAASKAVPSLQWKIGQAYSHRRLAFRKMVEILVHERSTRLSQVVPQMWMDVMETEDESTRSLVQMRTAPVSEASAKAWDALRSAGEDVPIDFTPMMYVSYDDAMKSFG